MAKIIFLLSLYLTAALGSPSLPRIVGGSTVDISRYPFLTGILVSNRGDSIFRHSCGGTIINNRSVLTAAHCHTITPAQYRVRVGSSFASSGGTVYNVANIIIHSDYSFMRLNHDIAVMRISGMFSFGNNIQVGRFGSYTIGDNQSVWAAGWGLTSFNGSPSEVLRHVQVWTVNRNTCQNSYGIQASITDYKLCAGPRVSNNGVCTRDSGGPLVHNGVVVGVVSFSGDCGQVEYPAVYTRVSRYINWIQSNS